MAWEWVIFCYLEGWTEVSNIIKNGLLVTEVLRRCLWRGAGDNHRSLMAWVRFPERKLAFPIGSSPRHMTGLHSWLDRGQEESPTHSPIIVLPISYGMKRNY